MAVDTIRQYVEGLAKNGHDAEPRMKHIHSWLLGDIVQTQEFVDSFASGSSSLLTWTIDQGWSHTVGRARLCIASLSTHAAIHTIRYHDFIVACDVVLEGRAFTDERPCIVHLPVVAKDAPTFAIPGGTPNNVALCLASVVIAHVVVVLNKQGHDEPLSFMQNMLNFASFPCSIQEPWN